MGLFLKKRGEMPDKIILGNTEFVFNRKLGFHVGEWTVWNRKTKILLEFQSTEGNIGDIVFEKLKLGIEISPPSERRYRVLLKPRKPLKIR